MTTHRVAGARQHDQLRSVPMGDYRTPPRFVPEDASERRTARALELREVETTDSLSRLSGIAVPYNEPTDIGYYLESFAPGALTAGLARSSALPLLLFHDDHSFPVGVAEEWHEESGGLRGVWRLSDSGHAQEAARLVREGMLAFMSIRFQPVRSEWTYVEDFAPDLGPAHKDSVVRTEARLIETSLVSTPAYQGAAVKWVRTGEQPMKRESGRRELDEWRRFTESARATR